MEEGRSHDAPTTRESPTYDPQMDPHTSKHNESKPQPEKPWFHIRALFGDIADIFGYRFLAYVICGQHLLRGFAEGLSHAATPYLFRRLYVPADLVNVFSTVTNVAYACKISVGVISDIFPFGPYRQMPLLVATGILGVSAFVAISSVPTPVLGVTPLVVLLFLTRFQAAACEVLTEAQVAIKIRENPEKGTRIIPFMTGGVLLMHVIGGLAYGAITNNGTLTPRVAMAVCTCFAVPVLMPSMLNFHGERWLTPEQKRLLRGKIFTKNYKLLGLALSTNVAAVLLVCMNMFIPGSVWRFVASFCIMVIEMIALNMIVQKEIARPITAYMVIVACILDINGATYYFYTDTPVQFRPGPNFTPLFYNTALNVVHGVFLVFGIWLYQRYLEKWSYRMLLQAANTLSALFFLLDVVIYARVNIALHIPDSVFAIVVTGLKAVPETWDYMVMVSLMSKFCPEDMEATIFAVLSCMVNLGGQVNNYFGAFLLEELGVNPMGYDSEEHQFDQLWVAALVAACLPLLGAPLIHWFIPAVDQTQDMGAIMPIIRRKRAATYHASTTLASKLQRQVRRSRVLPGAG